MAHFNGKGEISENYVIEEETLALIIQGILNSYSAKALETSKPCAPVKLVDHHFSQGRKPKEKGMISDGPIS